jgi:hypothetical protein
MPTAPTARNVKAWGNAPGKIHTMREALKARDHETSFKIAIL